MPRIWINGVAAGFDAQVSYDKQVVAPRGTSAQWLTTTSIVFNGLVSPPGTTPEVWRLQTYDITTRTIADLPGGARGANAIAAGGGKWLAWLAGYGVYDAAGNVWPAAGLAGPTVSGDGRGAAARDGTLAMVQNRGEGSGLLLLPPVGPAVVLPDIAIGKLTIESRAVACWTENSQVVAWGVPNPAPQADPVFSAQSIWTGRERLLLVTGYERLWLRKWNEPLGMLIVGNNAGFNADAMALDPDTIRVCWAMTAGERPDGILWTDIKVADLVNPVEPPVPPLHIPTFTFDHPVLVVPYKDPDLQAGTEYRMDDGSLGVYTEAADPSAAIAEADRLNDRCLVAHDAPTSWIPPAALRAWDLPFIECYRLKSETLEQSVMRWHDNLMTLILAWPNDLGLIAQFYCQGGAPPNELWTIAEVLDALRPLSDLVNASPRVKAVAPFAYARANGITAHPELQATFANLKAAAGSDVELMPIPTPQPPDPPDPPLPDEFRFLTPYGLGGLMETERGGLVGPGGKFARSTHADAGKGLFGWYALHFDADAPEGDAEFELADLGNGRGQAQHITTGAYFGVDMTKFSNDLTKQFYLKPDDPQGYEQPFLLAMPDGTKLLMVEYEQTPDVPHPFVATPVSWVSK